MSVNSTGDFIKSVFSPMIDKSSVIFRALFSDDDGSGTVEKIFNELEETRKTWEKDGANLYNQRGEQLEKSLSLFSVLNRSNSDTDEAILNRFALLFQRGWEEVWGDKWDVLLIFKKMFGTEKVWLVNNTERFSENLLENGNFEGENGWNVSGARYDAAAHFEGTRGVRINGAGEFSQTVAVNGGKSYFLHFFLKGNVSVSIAANGKFWNPNSGEFGCWCDEEMLIPFESEDWDSHSFFFITDEGMESATVRFSCSEGAACVDYARLNQKTSASTYSVIVLFTGKAGSKSAIYAPGTDDPVAGINYDDMSYFDDSFVFGDGIIKENIFTEIMGIVGAGGTTGILEFLLSDS